MKDTLRQRMERYEFVALGHRFVKFPNKKPADYKECRIILVDDTVTDAIRYDTGFGREWATILPNKRLVFDEEVKGWWYI